MILQINAVELAASLASARLEELVKTAPTLNEETKNDCYQRWCDWYMEMITNAEDTSIGNPVGIYYPVEYVNHYDVVDAGYFQSTEEDMKVIGEKMLYLNDKDRVRSNLIRVCDFMGMNKTKEDEKD